jgi:hypothetical protein
MQEQAEEKGLGVRLRTPHLSQVPGHWSTASLWPLSSLRATEERGGPVNALAKTPKPQSSQVMIWRVAERPERSRTVIKLLVVSKYEVLTHSIEPAFSRFQGIDSPVGSG